MRIMRLYLGLIGVIFIVNIYDRLRDDNGDLISGRTKLFIQSHDSTGIQEYLSGIACTPEGPGIMFIVDEWLIDQLHKVRLHYGQLSVKDGEELEPPVKSDLELEEEELRRQLEDIRRRRAEKEREKEESERIPVTPENLKATATDKEIKLDWQSTDNR